MLRQSHGPGDDLTVRYLLAFGVADVSLGRLPAIISANFEPEWRAFLAANTELHGTASEKVLRAVLSFVRYSQELKLNAIDRKFSFKDPLTSSGTINVNRIRLALVRETLITIYTALQKYLLKMRLSQYFRVHRAKSSTCRIGTTENNIVTVFVLASRNPRQHLDAILPSLEGKLYDGSVPPQLAPLIRNKKDARPYFDTLLTGASVLGWYSLIRSSAFSVYATRAKSGYLVLKVIVPIGYISRDNGDIPLKERLQIWAKFKLFQ